MTILKTSFSTAVLLCGQACALCLTVSVIVACCLAMDAHCSKQRHLQALGAGQDKPAQRPQGNIDLMGGPLPSLKILEGGCEFWTVFENLIIPLLWG